MLHTASDTEDLHDHPGDDKMVQQGSAIFSGGSGIETISTSASISGPGGNISPGMPSTSPMSPETSDCGGADTIQRRPSKDHCVERPIHTEHPKRRLSDVRPGTPPQRRSIPLIPLNGTTRDARATIKRGVAEVRSCSASESSTNDILTPGNPVQGSYGAKKLQRGGLKQSLRQHREDSSSASSFRTSAAEESQSEQETLQRLEGVSQGFASTLKRASAQLGATFEGWGDLLLGEPAFESSPEQASSSTGGREPQPRQKASSSCDGRCASASSSSRQCHGHCTSQATSRLPSTFQAAVRAVKIGNSLAAGSSQTVNMKKLMREVRVPFQQLMTEVHTPSTSADRSSSVEAGRVGDPNGGRSDSSGVVTSALGRLSSQAEEAIARARLSGYVLGCCQAVTSELSTDEARLWDAFIDADRTLTGTVAVHRRSSRNGELSKLLTDCFGESDRLEAWLFSLGEAADENGEIEFADLLEWYTRDQEVEHLWFSSTSVRASFFASLGEIMNMAATTPQMKPERISELRNRCATMSRGALAEAAVAYQRSLLLTNCWQCENRVASTILSATPDGEVTTTPQPVHVLLSLLRHISSKLAPTERVLWEIITSKDKDFDGAFTKQEVLGGIGELLVYTLERELTSPSTNFEELQRLRSKHQRRSVDKLFQGSRLTVTIADVIYWWWKLPEEYRIAAGLSVPAALVRRSIHRKPEQMFVENLRLAATNISVANTALHGHVRVYAELRALDARLTMERLHSQSPHGTGTTCSSRRSSEAGSCGTAEETAGEAVTA